MVRLKIAIAGTRGTPARYGGFETFAEELSMAFIPAEKRRHSPASLASAVDPWAVSR